MEEMEVCGGGRGFVLVRCKISRGMDGENTGWHVCQMGCGRYMVDGRMYCICIQ